MRVQPSTKAEVHCMATKGLYNVLQETEAEGYLWFEIEEGRWIATDEGNWTIDKPVILTLEEKLQLQIDNLTKELNKAKESNQELQNQLNAANSEKVELKAKLENDLQILSNEKAQIQKELDAVKANISEAQALRDAALEEANLARVDKEKLAQKLENIRIAGEWK